MTRGRFLLLTNINELLKSSGLACKSEECITLSSTEFNGDMHMRDNGHGSRVIELLKNVNTVEGFKNAIRTFNNESFKYSDKEITTVFNSHEDLTLANELNFSRSIYYNLWSSDYLYIKNINNYNVEAIDYHGYGFTINKNDLIVLHFGKIYSLESALGKENL